MDEKVLHHNYDIPPSMSLHFPDGSTGMIGRLGNIYVYKCTFLAGVWLPFAPTIRELLSFLGITLGQLMPNGWRYFLATFLLWPVVFSLPLSISEFLNIYGPHIYPTYKMVTLIVRGKNQFIKLGSTYSNNKH
jgi:hypothetical protein